MGIGIGTAALILGGVSAAAGAGTAIYQGEKQRKAQSRANRRADELARRQAREAAESQRRAQIEQQRANRAEPDRESLIEGARRRATNTSPSSTMLTGSSGAQRGQLLLGQTSSLGT